MLLGLLIAAFIAGTVIAAAKADGGIAEVIAVIAIVLAVLAAVKIAGNEMNRTSPPASCQILGGSWDLWNGWRCG